MERIYNLNEIGELGNWCAELSKNYKVIALHGSMGAGKTTLVNAWCRALGVKDAVSSPTFSIINQYQVPDGFVYHIDLYRLKDEEEALRAGVEDCVSSGRTCLIEWPEIAADLLPADTVHVWLSLVDEQTRRIRLEIPAG